TFLKNVFSLNNIQMVGYAFTLRYIPAREDLDFDVDYDNLKNPQRKAVEKISTNEILVIDARGNVEAASFGHILCTRLQQRGVSGLVTDGALRDSPQIKKMNFPCFYQA